MIKSKIIIKRYQQEFSLPHLYYIPVLTLLEPSTGFATEEEEEARVCLSVLTAERIDDNIWDALVEKVTSIAEVYEIQPCIPRTTGRQQHRSNVEADTTSAYWKRCMYLPFLDHLVNKLDELSVKPFPGFQAQLLIPGKEIYSICILFILPRKCTNK